MRGAPFRHIGGSVATDNGPIRIAAARRLAGFYRAEAAVLLGRGEIAAAQVCAQRAGALATAAEDAALWRRAAGWSDPELADAVRRP